MTIWYPTSYESLFFHLWQLNQGLNIASKLEWRKVILCSDNCVRHSYEATPGRRQLVLGGWDLIAVDKEFHKMKFQESLLLLLCDFTYYSHTLLNCFQREHRAGNLNQLKNFSSSAQ